MPRAGSRRHAARLALAGAVLLGLLVLVAFASRAGFGRSAGAEPSQVFLDWAFSIFLVLLVAGLPVSLAAYVISARGGMEPVRRRSFAGRVSWSLVSLLVVFACVWLLQYAVHRHHGVFARVGLHGLGGAERGLRGGAAHPAPTFQWPAAVVAGVLGIAAFAAWLVARPSRERVPVPVTGGPLAAVVAGAIDEAIDDLEAEPDARRAVIAAYARMETALGRSGLRRRPSETALEYLRRVLVASTARGDAVERLTGLFQEARFSVHEIDAAMKREAIGALVAIRDGLRGAPA